MNIKKEEFIGFIDDYFKKTTIEALAVKINERQQKMYLDTLLEYMKNEISKTDCIDPSEIDYNIRGWNTFNEVLSESMIVSGKCDLKPDQDMVKSTSIAANSNLSAAA